MSSRTPDSWKRGPEGCASSHMHVVPVAPTGRLLRPGSRVGMRRGSQVPGVPGPVLASQSIVLPGQHDVKLWMQDGKW